MPLAKARLDKDDGRAGYADGLFVPAVPVFSLDILDPDAASFPQAGSRFRDEAQKARVVFELEVEQSPSDPKPISTPADLPLRVMTISSRSASRRNRERSSLISENGIPCY